jgi:hypothetical protein
MRLRWKIASGTVVLILVCAFLAWRSSSGAHTELESTRRDLKKQGFKLEMKEFNLAAPSDMAACAAVITNAGWICAQDRNLRQVPELMASIGTNAAVALWKETELPNPYSGKDAWPELRSAMKEHGPLLNSVCQSVLAGPFQFEPVERSGTLLLPYLANVKILAQTFAIRTSLELHDGKPLEAYTNLLALTRLTTAWKPEPVDITHLVRAASAAIAENATWEALQTNAWTDQQLSRLQQEWESVDFLSGLPETAALSRVNAIGLCESIRQEPLDPGAGKIVTDAVRSPKNAQSDVTWLSEQVQYRRKGSYEDENQLMLYYRDRELELQRAVKSASWLEMRRLPGVTNTTQFVSKQKGSRVQSILSLKQLGPRMQADGLGLLGRASVAEARRRVIITALVLERYRLRNGTYPESLDSLAPSLLKAPPIDFMDGKPLRYRRTADGHFIVYSVGPDCADDQGLMMPVFSSRRTLRPSGFAPGTDIVWPRPASPEEVSAQESQQRSSRIDLEN